MSVYAYGNTMKCSPQFNEDFYYVNKIGDYIVLAVADGNGGSNGAVNPGALAITLITDYLKHIIQPTTSIKEIANAMELGMFVASRGFLAVNAVDERFVNMYSSLTVAVIEDVSLNMVVGSIGNTEIRMLRNGKYTRLTTLHSEAAEMSKRGEFSDEDIYLHPKRGIVTSALGVFDAPKIEVLEMQLQKEDILLFATDGLYRQMNPGTVLQLLSDYGENIQNAVNKILKENEDAENPDNVSLIVAYVQDDNGLSEQRQANYYPNASAQMQTYTQQTYTQPSPQPSYQPSTGYNYGSNTGDMYGGNASPYNQSVADTTSYDDGYQPPKKKKKSYLYY